MHDNVTSIEMLFEKVEDYSKTTIELLKLHAIRKSADVFSSMISKAVITISVALSIFILNIGVALWVGKLVGQSYYGFFIVAGIYVIVALILYLFRFHLIKKPIRNSLINKMMNEQL